MERTGKMINKSHLLTYLYLLIYILLSSGVILYNKWVLSPKYFNFPLPITLTMIHMGFSGAVAFFLVRVIKVVPPVKMTFEIYATCVIPISAFFASSLWFGNTAYLHISVAFIQMLKALMPVATFLMAVVCGTDKLRCDLFLNMLLVSVGVVVSSYGEIHFNVVGTLYQVTGIFAEALRLVLTQVLLQKKGLTLNPITSLYYIAPCSFLFLFVPWYLLEKPGMEVTQIQFNFYIFFSNALCALALNFSIFLVIGRTGAVTIRNAGVLKDWILLLHCLWTTNLIEQMNAKGLKRLQGIFPSPEHSNAQKQPMTDALPPQQCVLLESLDYNKVVKSLKQLVQSMKQKLNHSYKCKENVKENLVNNIVISPKNQLERKALPHFESFIVEEEEGGYGTVYRVRRKNDGKRDVGHNHFVGTLRKLTLIEGCFPALRNLYLNNNFLTGGVPAQLANLTNLEIVFNGLVDHFKMALDCFFAVWFVVGNVWIFGGHSSPSDAPKLYRLCIAFLTFSCIGYAMPFILCAAICCCLPCIISILGFREDLSSFF